MKLKLDKSAKIHRRYLLIEAKGREIIESSLIDYLGILGYAKASPIFIEEKKLPEKLILAVNRKELANVRAAFEISQEKIKVIKVSGTIKGLLS